MKRWCCLIFLFLLIGCATTTPLVGPDGGDYKVHTDRHLKIQLPVPSGWSVSSSKTPFPTLRVQMGGTEASAGLTVFLNPNAISAAEVHKDLLAARKSPPKQAIEGRVDGRQALGFRDSANGKTATAFVVDHDRGIYVIVMKATTPQEQATLDFIFARIRLLED